MTHANDQRYTDQNDDARVLEAWAGTDRQHCEVPMGGWLDDDSDAFLKAVRDQWTVDLGYPPAFIVVIDRDGDDVDDHHEPVTVPALRVESVERRAPEYYTDIFTFDVVQQDGAPVGELYLKARRDATGAVIVYSWGAQRSHWCSDEAHDWLQALEDAGCDDGFHDLLDVCQAALNALAAVAARVGRRHSALIASLWRGFLRWVLFIRLFRYG